jgi:hypothetical protein
MCDLYQNLRRQGFSDLKCVDLPILAAFDRKELPPQAFKSGAQIGRFFEDARGRAFPPDPYHGRLRIEEVKSGRGQDDPAAEPQMKRLLLLRQRYRFGVLVRDGNLHFDVQYRKPRNLKMEAMICGSRGPVFVSASHANVGANDVIWTPDGSAIVR